MVSKIISSSKTGLKKMTQQGINVTNKVGRGTYAVTKKTGKKVYRYSKQRRIAPYLTAGVGLVVAFNFPNLIPYVFLITAGMFAFVYPKRTVNFDIATKIVFAVATVGAFPQSTPYIGVVLALYLLVKKLMR